MTETKKCEFCDKRGLPLLLVRDAVARAGKGAPLANDLPIELAAAAAHYTKRLLRSGYVNVYDEARKRWEAYFVTPEGYYFKLLLPKPGVAPVVPVKPFNCPDQGHSQLASCITIPDPKRATKVWIGFSDALWTDAVRAANESPAYRKRHMVEINVQAALAGGNPAPARPIAQLSAVVAEYAMNPRVAKAALGWSPFRLSLRQGGAQSLVDAFEGMRPGKGLIVTLTDPAGVVQELAALMKHSLDEFMDGPDYRRNLAASAAISQLESSIKRQGEISEIDAAQALADQRAINNPLGHLLFESERKQTAKMRDVTAGEVTKNAKASWQKYAEKFDNKARTAWLESYNAKLKAHDAKYIAPLAKNHVAWITSLAMINHFECNYDQDSVDSGLVYTSIITRCVAGTQDKLACAVLYDKWIEGEVTDKSNLGLQAMLLNLRKVKDAVKSATTVSIDPRQIPWDNLFAIFTTSVGRVADNAGEVAANLVVQFAGPISRMLGKVMDGTPKFRAAVMSLGIIAGHPIVLCTVDGGKKKFREYLVKALYQASGQGANKNQLRQAISSELKRLQVHGTPLEGNTSKRWLVLLDQEALKTLPPGQDPAKWMASSIRTVEQVEALNLERWRTVISSNVRFGIIAGILQFASLTKLITDEDKALANENLDARMRMYAGIGAFATTTADVIANIIQKRAEQGLRYGQGLLAGGGAFARKLLGGAAIALGLFVAGLDARKAVESAQEGQPGLAFLYGASAALGVTATLAIAGIISATIPVIALLVLLIIVIAIVIEYLKDNPVQDWLERCPWGILPTERYKDMATEQAQLAQALK